MKGDTMGKRIAILTSGGDAPGMNAVIRAVVRTGIHYGMKVYGVNQGYDGLIKGDVEPMTSRSVADIIFRGGTILKTARCPEMHTPEGVKKAAEVVKILRLDGLVIAGGDGSFKGALELSRLGVNVMGIPATIDLDIQCTEYSIGFDTAVNTAVEAIIRIRDTSSSHERCSIVEVMGRDAGHLALWCGIAGGAEEVLIPENPANTTEVIEQILLNRSKGKRHNLVVVAEGIGGSTQLAKEIEKVLGIESRATILGHLQRGGTPTAADRMHGSVMGYMAVNALHENNVNKVVTYIDGKHCLIDMEDAVSAKKQFSPEIYNITKVLSI